MKMTNHEIVMDSSWMEPVMGMLNAPFSDGNPGVTWGLVIMFLLLLYVVSRLGSR